MANLYFVDRYPQVDGLHKVHADGCTLVPEEEDRLNLGFHDTPQSALKGARLYYARAHPCFYCARTWHFGLVDSTDWGRDESAQPQWNGAQISC
ncbi:hypothetical protein [Marinobacter sp. NFXS9]|uniref:hypothetical protein n=1 Tax=Marinobacter sp. NFXS9 TaxID=2818433 RepID=UPI0032E01F4E